MIQATDGKLYGTTSGGSGFGTVFKISRGGKLTTLHTFGDTDGDDPSGLVQATDGNFYGTTFLGGDLSQCAWQGCGTVFQMNPAGILTTLYIFNSTQAYHGQA